MVECDENLNPQKIFGGIKQIYNTPYFFICPTNVITVGTRDAPYTLDGLLYHESDLQIEEH
ncbi:hypothetical protein DBR25_07840, partial [Chryseobacterium sp. HMWF001]